jgi:hypothetical protein
LIFLPDEELEFVDIVFYYFKSIYPFKAFQ